MQAQCRLVLHCGIATGQPGPPGARAGEPVVAGAAGATPRPPRPETKDFLQ
jgi:hypothetical protein